MLGGVTGAPLVVDRLAVAASLGGEVAAFDLDDGRSAGGWPFRRRSTARRRTRSRWASSAARRSRTAGCSWPPTASAACDLRDGATLWEAEPLRGAATTTTSGGRPSSPPGWCSWAPARARGHGHPRARVGVRPARRLAGVEHPAGARGRQRRRRAGARHRRPAPGACSRRRARRTCRRPQTCRARARSWSSPCATARCAAQTRCTPATRWASTSTPRRCSAGGDDRGHRQGRRVGVEPAHTPPAAGTCSSPRPRRRAAARPAPPTGRRAGRSPPTAAVPRPLQRRAARRLGGRGPRPQAGRVRWQTRPRRADLRRAGRRGRAGCWRPRPAATWRCCARATAAPVARVPLGVPSAGAVAIGERRLLVGVGAEPFLPGGELVCMG